MTTKQNQQAIEALAPFSTAALIEALKNREGVEHCFVELDERCEVAVCNKPTIAAPKVEYREGGMHEVDSGPCVILKVID